MFYENQVSITGTLAVSAVAGFAGLIYLPYRLKALPVTDGNSNWDFYFGNDAYRSGDPDEEILFDANESDMLASRQNVATEPSIESIESSTSRRGKSYRQSSSKREHNLPARMAADGKVLDSPKPGSVFYTIKNLKFESKNQFSMSLYQFKFLTSKVFFPNILCF